jgi:hypothetical protein
MVRSDRGRKLIGRSVNSCNMMLRTGRGEKVRVRFDGV